MRIVKIFLLLAFVAAISGCSYFMLGDIETLYSYREVGLCNGQYLGESHTPDKRIANCVGLITTKVSLNVSQPTQTVTIVEEDLQINKQFEPIILSATKLTKCSIIDRKNFRCEGLERKDSVFVDVSLLADKRLSTSFLCSIYARYFGGGWLDSGTLDFHETIWSSVMYSVIALIFLIGAA